MIVFMKRIDFDNGKITTNILQAALPMLIAQILSLLYNIVDRIYIARIPNIGTAALGAVGLCFPIIVIITAFSNLFGSGGAPLFSIERGRGDKKRAGMIMNTSFFMLSVCAIVLMCIGFIFARPILILFGASENALVYAYPYIMIYLIGTFPSMIATGMNPFINAQGYATTGMISVVIGAIANIVLDPLFIFMLNLGIRGAALSTMISQYVSFGILLFFFLRGKTQSSLAPKYFTWEFAVHKNILTAGFPSMMRQGLASVSTMMLNAQAAVYGDIAIAAMSVVSRIFNFVFSVALGIGQGFQPVSSFNYGAKKYSRVKKAFWFTLCASLVTMAVFAGVVYVFRRELLLQFLTDMDAYEIAFYALQIQCLTLPFIPVCICGNMLFQSIGKGGRATILASFRSGTIYIPALLILTAFWGIRGIQWSQPVSDILSAVLSLPVAVAFLKGLPEDSTEV